MTLTNAMVTFSPGMLKLIIGIAIVIAGILILALFVPWLRDFRREMRYINMEIQRNTGKERERWIKRKKRLKLSILPFFHY